MPVLDARLDMCGALKDGDLRNNGPSKYGLTNDDLKRPTLVHA